MLDIFDSTCILLAKAEQKHINYTKKILEIEKMKITPGQMAVLYTLYKGDGISITELSSKIYLDNSTLTGLIDKLERQKLLIRAEQPEDRRRYLIYLTENAWQIREHIFSVMNQICEKMLEGCSQEEINIFRKVLITIFNNL